MRDLTWRGEQPMLKSRLYVHRAGAFLVVLMLVAGATGCDDPCEALKDYCKTCEDATLKQACENAVQGSVNDAACEASLDAQICDLW